MFPKSLVSINGHVVALKQKMWINNWKEGIDRHKFIQNFKEQTSRKDAEYTQTHTPTHKHTQMNTYRDMQVCTYTGAPPGILGPMKKKIYIYIF